MKICIYNLSGGYETPGGAILLAAHIDLEVFTMDRISGSEVKFYFIDFQTQTQIFIVFHLILV